MKISIVAAVSANGVIGHNNDLLWKLPKDMKFFKELTEHHPVIMGRKTWESIPEKWRPLPNRYNIVLTNGIERHRNGGMYTNGLVSALTSARLSFSMDHPDSESEVFIIGGGQIYKEAIGIAEKMYITEIYETFEGDIKFPKIDLSVWKETSRVFNERDDKNPHDFDFVTYERII